MPAVIWDLDGTLVDSAEYHWQSWEVTLRAAGVPVTREQFAATFGQRNDRILRAWLGPSAAPERIAALGEAKEVAYRDLMREGGLDPLPGAAHWVHALAAEGWAQAIASSAPRLNVEAVLDVLGWHRYFATTVAAEDVTAGKPDPEVFLVAATRLRTPPSQCVVVEDAAAGVEAARRAGMRCIGVGPAVAAGPDLAAPSLADLGGDAFHRLLGLEAPR
jgi:beta-phosphoglucomutase family hydrolase